MQDFKATRYFREQIQTRRPEVKLEWCLQALMHPDHKMIQEDGRIRYYLYITEIRKFIRVVTLEDGITIHNAFFDRNFKPREQ